MSSQIQTHISIFRHMSHPDLTSSQTLKRRLNRILNHPLIASQVPANLEITLTLTDDQEIHQFNAHYRGFDKPTDVLSFALQEGETFYLPPDLPVPLGDLIISIETTQRQVERGPLPRLNPLIQDRVWGLNEEVSFLMLHGLLHLIGYDHIEDNQAHEMEMMEATLLPTLLGWTRTRRRST